MCIPVQFVRHQNCSTFPEDGASSVREVEIVPDFIRRYHPPWYLGEPEEERCQQIISAPWSSVC